MRKITLTAMMTLAIAGVGVGSAFAQRIPPSTEVGRDPGQLPARAQPGGDGIAANGRCGGVSFGTGASRCGDASGGPSGGLSSRN